MRRSSNPLVRQAIAHAINRPALIAATLRKRRGRSHSSFCRRGVWGYDPGLADYSYDPALAKSLLAQAGYPNGFTTTLTYRNVVAAYLPNPPATAAAIQADLAAVGIDAGHRDGVWPLSSNKVDAGDVDLFLLGWVADYPHPANFFAPTTSVAGNLAFGPHDDVAVQLRWQAAMADPDLSSQLTRYRWAAGRVHSTLPALPLVHTTTSSSRPVGM